MRTILTNLMQLAGLQLVLAVTGLVRNAVISRRLGPEGLGEFNILYELFATLGTLVIFGMAVGLSRNVAATQDKDERQKILGTANFIIWTLTIAATLVVIFGFQLGYFSLELFKLQLSPAVLISSVLLLISLPLKALESNYIAFLTGIMDIKGMTSGRSVAVIAGTILTVPIVWFFGFVGATIQYLILTLLLVILLGYRCVNLGYRPWAIRWHRPTAYGLAFFGIASLINSFVQNTSGLAIRTALINQVSAAENGLYTAALLLTSQVKTIVLSSVSSYSLAAISQNQSRENITHTANQLLKVVLPLAALAAAALGVFSVPALIILASPKFISAAHYFPLLLAADFVQVFIWVIGAPLLALKMVRTWLVLDLIQWGARWSLVIFLLPILGPQAVVTAWFAATLLHLSFNLYFYFGHLEFGLDREHFVHLLAGLALVLGCSYLGATGAWQYIILAGLLWLGYLAWIIQTRIGMNQVPGLLKRLMKGRASA
jgi:O-antigen/teichoic acid export membrane protein